jgi:maltooligosyltrehalose trehalohydrolase
VTFAVWAPRASSVLLERDGGSARDRVALECDERGWWRTSLSHQGAYRYVVDGFATADPRSPWQPEGLSGPSHTVDHTQFPWTDGEWHGRPFGCGVIYELHVGTFSAAGTFDGVVDHLDHLLALGVDVIELMPVAEFPGRRGWGYDGAALYAPHHAYGGPDGLRRLVDACHARDVSVVLDVVYNHLGPTGNHLDRFGPYFTDRHGTPWGKAINLDDRGSTEVRRFLCDNAQQWLRDYHVDGLRLDAVHAMFDQSAQPFLEQLAIEVDQLGRAQDRTFWLIAESDLNDPRLVRSRDANGFGLDAQWNDDVHHALHAALTGERGGYYADFGGLRHVADAFEHGFVFDGRYARSRARRHGRSADDIPKHQFVAFLQNHDQIGNRAAGERLGALTSLGRVRIGAALLMLGPFTPLLFQGEEWATGSPFQYFTDHEDPAVADAVRAGRRAEFAAFGWPESAVPDPQAIETFERSRLDWAEVAGAEHHAMVAWYQRLIALRRQFATVAPVAAAIRCDVDPATGRIVMVLGTAIVAANLGPRALEMTDLGAATLVAHAGAVSHGAGTLRLGVDAVAVLRAEGAGNPGACPV